MLLAVADSFGGVWFVSILVLTLNKQHNVAPIYCALMRLRFDMSVRAHAYHLALPLGSSFPLVDPGHP